MALVGKTLAECFNSLHYDHYEKIVSVGCSNSLMTWTEINDFFQDLAKKEMKRRINALNKAVVDKGLSLADNPFQVNFCDFCEDVNNIVQYKNKIEISGMRMTLRFLRFFGDDIKFLNCNFYGASEEQTFIVFGYITKYCPGLTKLYINFLRHNLSFSLRKSFENVSELIFSHSKLDLELCKISTYFPRVQELSFYDRNEFQNLRDVICTYPHLRRMTIECQSMDILSVAILQAINPNTKLSYMGCDLDVTVFGL